MSRPASVGSLKVGRHLVIDDEAYKITKKSIVSPVDARVDIPIIEKRSAQVLSLESENVQLMDLESYEVFYTPIPSEEDLSRRVDLNAEVEYWTVLGRRKIIRVKGVS
jgi:translation initiation factor 5A